MSPFSPDVRAVSTRNSRCGGASCVKDRNPENTPPPSLESGGDVEEKPIGIVVVVVVVVVLLLLGSNPIGG